MNSDRISPRSLSASIAGLTLLFVAATTLFAADRRTDKSRLTVMTFNAEFLFDGVLPDGQANFDWKGSPSEAKDHMEVVAAEILENHPDIVNVCEVENLGVLETMNTMFLAGQGYKAYLIDGKDSFTGQDVGILTRIDPDEPLSRDERVGQSGTTKSGVSKHYIAHFTIEGEKVAMIGLHLLALPLSNSRKLQRQAQADAVRGMATDAASSGFQVIVLGDLNDYDGETLDAENDHPITNVLSTIRGMSTATTSDDLESVAEKIAQGQRYTSWYDKDGTETVSPGDAFTSIDHVLVSPSLFAKIASVHLDQNHDPTRVSDHFPVVVTFQMKPPIDTGTDTGTATSDSLAIVSLLPNPAGDENEGEEITLKNLGTSPVPLAGWKFEDKAKTEWLLDATDGTIAPGATKTVRRRSRDMALNNGGDTVKLIKSGGTVVQTVTYAKTVEGQEILP